jgi:hypothetical protein
VRVEGGGMKRSTTPKPKPTAAEAADKIRRILKQFRDDKRAKIMHAVTSQLALDEEEPLLREQQAAEGAAQ